MDDLFDDAVEISIVDLRDPTGTDPQILIIFQGAAALAAVEKEKMRIGKHDANAPTHSRTHFP